MKKTLRYKIVIEGEYDVDSLDYDTEDVNEIAEQEREYANADPLDYINNTGCEPVEILILPV